jgi:hypothetical protein
MFQYSGAKQIIALALQRNAIACRVPLAQLQRRLADVNQGDVGLGASIFNRLVQRTKHPIISRSGNQYIRAFHSN